MTGRAAFLTHCRLLLCAAAAVVAAAACLPAVAQASFGLNEFDVTFTNAPPLGSELGTLGPADLQAGSHPFAMTTTLGFNSTPTAGGGAEADAPIKDTILSQVAGFVGNPTAVPPCSTADFLTRVTDQGGTNVPNCPADSAIGVAKLTLASDIVAAPIYASIYSLVPPPGVASELGLYVGGIPVPIELGISDSPPYEIVGGGTNISQLVEVISIQLTIWGVPADPAHDSQRGHCLDPGTGGSFGSCPVTIAPKPFLTLPRACRGPLETSYAADSWENPGLLLPGGHPDLEDPNWVSGEVETNDGAQPPSPQGFTECDKLAFNPDITAQPTTKAASSPTGLDFSLDAPDEGLVNSSYEAVAASDIEKAEVTLPEGMSTNPSLAEGLGVCTEAQLAEVTAFSAPGVGCPDASKIGTIEVETPVLEGKLLKGSLFIAKPYENEFHSLLALYIVIQNPELGIVVKQAARVEPNALTGQLTTITENMPQLPFSHFRLHFREGTRSPLASPPSCGEHAARAVLYPYAGGAPIESSSVFSIVTGPDSGPCPSGGTPPFHPGLIAGSINNAAGAYSPFNVRIFRTDSEQEITHFSIKLPPGVTGKLAGIPFCPDAAIAAAKARERTPHGGEEEIERPSCPQASEIGRTLVGAGVGPALTYVPGRVYLAGPYNGSNLSIVAITAAKAGPFDLGTVVIREALKVNPETAEVSVDAAGSDPIPHIIDGIPVHLRDIRAYVDRPEFVLNPTSCEPTSTASTVLGSGTNFASEADDRPVTVSTRFQAADCASLGFKPNLKLALSGPTKRAGLPKLKAVVTARPGDANIGRAVVTLPKSEFLEQGHIGSSCTRVQFNAGGGNGEQCPANSLLGHAVAITPLLEEPIEGPVYLRSNGGERKLPDLVAALHSKDININLVGFIDSLHKKGSSVSQIRTTFAAVPDQPVTKFTLQMFGGKKGLLVNSTNLCKGTHKAISEFTGQNGKVYDTEPAVQVRCRKAKKKGHAKAKKGDTRLVAAVDSRLRW